MTISRRHMQKHASSLDTYITIDVGSAE